MASPSSFRAVSPVRRPRLSDAVTDRIEDLMASGTLRPGDRLAPERDLALQLDVARAPLREALLVLERRGLLQAQRGGGFSVTDVTVPTITDPLAQLLQRHPETVDDILELRHGLECVAAEFAARHATDADGQRLREIAAAMKHRRGPVDPLEDTDRDVDFHMTVVEASHNVVLVHVMRGIFNLMRIHMLRTREALCHLPEDVARFDEQHDRIAKAIAATDPAAARAAAIVHLSFVQARLRESAVTAVRLGIKHARVAGDAAAPAHASRPRPQPRRR